MATPYTDAAQNCYNNYGGGKNKTELKKCLTAAGKLSDDHSYAKDAVIDTATEAPKSVIAFLLRAILNFVILLLNLAEIIFQWIVNPDVMKAIIDNSAIYKSWMAVRDVFNIIFIMTLLFSAFATIFQVSKYNYKNILLNLILMALLVNFSYPIARFIIDVSNVVMYGFLQNMSGNYFMTIIENSGVTGLFNSNSTDLFYLISTIIFTFIFAITLDVIAILLLIRVVSLAIYVIFSPLGFVGSVLPGTKLASEGSKWWTDFLKNCFSGPIMIFMIYIANSTMVAISSLKNSGSDLSSIVSSQLDSNIKNMNGLQQLIVSAAFVSLPIIILWLGVIAAQSSGIAGAGAVVGYGKKVGKWLAKNPAMGIVGYGLRKSGVTGGLRQKWNNWRKTGRYFGSDIQEEREARRAGTGRFAVPHALDRLNAKKVKEASENHDMSNMGANRLRELANTGDQYERAGAIQELINQNMFDMNNADDENAYQTMEREFGQTSQMFTQINNKLKASDPVSAFAHIVARDENERRERMTEFINSNKFDARKLGANSLGNAEFMSAAFRNGAINNDDLEELRKKSPNHERNILASLGNIAGHADFRDISGLDTRRQDALAQSNNSNISEEARQAFREQATALDNQLRVARSVQTAHFAQTGNFHVSITSQDTSDSMHHLVSRLNEKTAKRITTDTVRNYGEDFVRHLNGSKYRAIIQNIDNGESQRSLNALAQDTQFAGTRNHNTATNDPDIRNIN